ncbi:helix-turn-helix domain-containing protein [Bordetella genomosp. 5]|uniref:AraC family transcriptional regulator n=1 Tax=Bordetella genomosp. 5 TaxID=1395608 RepID=A0A261U1R1_9BORD|nr:AraC family transcriptional regulator [Bordetella genomosp. 5]OZI55491.1 AraC family transcriptional regulator [Bordetella genomosp. 5]
MQGWSRSELAPLVARRVFRSRERDETRNRVSEALKDHHLSWQAGPVDARLSRAQVGALTICTLRYGPEVRIDPGRLRDFMLVQVPLVGRARVQCGADIVETCTRRAAVIAPDRPLALHWESGCEQLMLKIPRGLLDQVGQQAFGAAARRPLDFAPSLALDTPTGSTWRALVAGLLHTLPLLAQAAPVGTVPADIWTLRMQEMLVLHLLWHQPNTWRDGAHAVPRHLAQAEAYMHAHLAAPICAADIARHAGVSASQLARLFHAHRGTTPMSALRTLRLDSARDHLLSGAHGVTDAALAVGFGHLGRFSEYYRERHGELPSATLRRRARAN